MKKLFKVIWNYGNYDCVINTLGLPFSDFKVLHPNTIITLKSLSETHFVKVKYLKLQK